MERNAATLITSISCHKGHFLVTAAIHTVGNDSVLFFSWCHPFTLEEKWDTELVNSSRKMTQYWLGVNGTCL